MTAKSRDPQRPGGTLQRWREQGSLRYLAHCLGVTGKQIARYWDQGWIPRGYTTARGHRRIRYEADTVEQVRARVHAAKTTNIAIRHHLDTITWRGQRISLEGCHCMDDLYRRARRAGLPEKEARALAYRPRSRPEPAAGGAATDLFHDVLLRLKGVSQAELNESARFYAGLPLDALLEECPPREFRARAREAWRGIVEEMKAAARWERLHRAPPELAAHREKRKAALRALLAQRDRDAFVAAWLKITEPHHRIFEEDDAYFLRVKESVESDPHTMRLRVALLALGQAGETPSAAALARVLGISRRALYRAYGTEGIREVLRGG